MQWHTAVPRADSRLPIPRRFPEKMSFIRMSVPRQKQLLLTRDLALAAANIYKGRRKKTTIRKQKPSNAAEGE